MWPHSPAIPYVPRNSWPLMTRPPPMPVPRVMQTITDDPRPAPKRYSAQAAALASLSTISGRSIRSASRAFSGSDRQARCGENRTTACALSTQPAAPMPTESHAVVGAEPVDHVEDRVLDGLRAVRRASGLAAARGSPPCSSTTPAATLVPPMSTPMLSSGADRRPDADAGRVARQPSTRFFRPFRAPSMIVFSALRLNMPIIGMLTSTFSV